MNVTGLEKDESKILKFRDILPNILKYLPKVPGTIKALGQLKKMTSDAKMSLGVILEENAAKYGDSPAIKFEDLSFSHKEFNTIANQYAHYL